MALKFRKDKVDIAILCLFIFTLLFFSITNLDGGWVLDDHYQVERNPYIRSIAHIPYILKSRVWMATSDESMGSDIYRPVFLLSYLFDYHVAGLQRWFFHLHNNFLHAVNVVLLFLLATQWISIGVSFLLSLLFAVHPMNVEAVTWIGGRMDLQVTCCSLMMLHLLSPFLHGQFRFSRKRLVAFILLIPLGIYSKEVFVLIPFFALGLSWLKSKKVRNDTLLIFMAVAVIETGICLAWRSHVIGASTIKFLDSIAWVNFGAIVNRFFEILFVPTHSDFFPTYIAAQYPRWISLLWLVALVVGLALWGRRARKNVAYGIGLAVFLAPWVPLSLVVDLTHYRSERYFYMPLVGLVFFLGVWVDQFRRKSWNKTILPAFALWILVLVVILGFRNREWKDEVTLYESSIRQNPSNFSPFYSLAWVCRSKGDREGEIYNYREVLKRNPDHISTLSNLAVRLIEKKNFAEAKNLLTRAYKQDPKRTKTVFNIGYLFEERKDYARAQKWYEKALSLDPKYEMAEMALKRVEIIVKR